MKNSQIKITFRYIGCHENIFESNMGHLDVNENHHALSCRRVTLGRLKAKHLLHSVFFVVLSGCSLNGNFGETISLTRFDGSSVLVPLNGPLNNEKVERIAREIQSLDRIIASRKADTKSESEAAVISVAYESRNDALSELELALRIGQQTSAGQIDNGILRKAEQYYIGSKEVLRSPIPPNIFVATHISSSVANSTLHYISKGDYDAKKLSWISYSDGDRLKIGRYVFRVEPLETKSDFYEELVLVITEPTNRLIRPLRGTTE